MQDSLAIRRTWDEGLRMPVRGVGARCGPGDDDLTRYDRCKFEAEEIAESIQDTKDAGPQRVTAHHRAMTTQWVSVCAGLLESQSSVLRKIDFLSAVQN